MIALGNLIQFQDMNGSLLAAGYVFVYHLGRSELATIYNDHNGAHVADNPVRLDDMGMCDIYLNECYNYTVVVMDAYGQEMFSRDIYPGGHTGGDGRYEGVDPIVVNNDVNVISANTTHFGVQEPLYFVRDDESATIIGFSGTLPVPEGTMNESALGYQDSKITGYNGSAFSAGNSYEEGSYISIDGNTISVTGVQPAGDYQSAGDYVSASELENLQPRGDYYSASNPSGFLNKESADTLYQEKGNYQTAGDYYSASNPSGFINSDAISAMATTGFVAGVSADITAMIPTALTGDYLTKESADTLYQPIGNYQTAGDYQSALTFNYTNDNEISGINGSAIAGQSDGDYELVEGNGIQITDDPTAQTTTISVSGDYATNTQLQTVSGEITALIPTGEYLDKASADTLYYPLTGNPSGFITGVDLTPYQLTADMTAYQPTGNYLTTADSANFYTTANESGFLTAVPGTYLQNTDLGIDDNKVTAISGVEVGGGDSNVTTDIATFTVAPNTVGVPVNISYYTSTPVQEIATTITQQDFVMSNNRLILSSDANGINYSAGQIVNVEVVPNTLDELYLCYVNGNNTAAATTGDQGRIASDYNMLSGSNYSAVITAAPGTYTALALTTYYYNDRTNTANINKVELYRPNSALGFNVKIDNPTEFAKYSDPKVEFTGTSKFIVGTGNIANSNSLAVGYYNSASYDALSLGQYNTASDYDVAIGDNNSALGYYSVAIGYINNADNRSMAIGGGNSASYNSFAQGYYNSASYDSFAQGEYSTARDYSMAQGYRNSAQNYSLAQGRNNTAANNSLAQGGYNSARDYSIAQGEYNTAYNYSQAFGGFTKATNSGMAIGRYNLKEDGAFVVGNGTWQQRSDAFWIDHNGNVSAAGKISANGVELGAGGDVPEGVMVESGLEYNAVNEISAYNGSAIAQYGHEAQWLVHDDTIVHVSNSAQYAFGVNLSAIAQLLGVDETVLWETNEVLYQENSAVTLSENFKNFKELDVYYQSPTDDSYIANKSLNIFRIDPTRVDDAFSIGGNYLLGNDWWVTWCLRIGTSANGTSMYITNAHHSWGQSAYSNGFGDFNNNGQKACGGIYKVVGIGRKA